MRYQEEIIYCDSSEELEQVDQYVCELPFPEGTQDQAG